MSRLKLIDPTNATPAQREALEAVVRRTGPAALPVRALANAPAALSAFFAMHGALASGELGPALREQLALAVSNAQGCRYCVSFHALLARNAGVSAEAVALAQRGRAGDPRAQAALTLALSIVEHRGQVPDAELARARQAGLDDGAIVEVVAAVAATTFGNLLNRLAETELDLPVTELAQAEPARAHG